MKKVFGILFCIVGGWLITVGALVLLYPLSMGKSAEWVTVFAYASLLIGCFSLFFGIMKIIKNSIITLPTYQKKIDSTHSNPQNEINNDKYEIIEKLAKLRDQGVLTEEEFLEEKSKILRHI